MRKDQNMTSCWYVLLMLSNIVSVVNTSELICSAHFCVILRLLCYQIVVCELRVFVIYRYFRQFVVDAFGGTVVIWHWRAGTRKAVILSSAVW